MIIEEKKRAIKKNIKQSDNNLLKSIFFIEI
jgi:hypothetical protein